MERLAALVSQALDRDVLRYSQRVELLAEAARLGLSRFDANLVIAAVQHRANLAPEPPAETRRSVHLAPLAVAAAVELIVVLGAWMLLQ